MFIKVIEIFDIDVKVSLYISNNSNTKMDKVIFKMLFLLYVIVLIGNYLDAITTYFALQKDKTYETNTKMDYVIKHFGWSGFFLLKFILLTYLFLPLKYCPLPLSINFLRKRIPVILNVIVIFIIIIAYVVIAYYYWVHSFNNLKFIV